MSILTHTREKYSVLCICIKYFIKTLYYIYDFVRVNIRIFLVSLSYLISTPYFFNSPMTSKSSNIALVCTLSKISVASFPAKSKIDCGPAGCSSKKSVKS